MKRIIGIPFSKKNKDNKGQSSVAPAPGAAPESQGQSTAENGPVEVSPAQILPPQVPEEKPVEDSAPVNPPPVKEPGWLYRIGLKKKTQPLDQLLPELVNKTEIKIAELEKKIAICDAELKPISVRLKKVAEGGVKNNLRAKAQGIIQRKKRYEQQAEVLRQQSFNIDQTGGTLQSTKDAVHVVGAIKQGAKELKKEQKKVDLDALEDLHDEMGELLENSEQVQDVLGSGFKVPETIDDKELEEQLNLLGDEIAADADSSYLDEVRNKNASSKPFLLDGGATEKKNGIQAPFLPTPEVDIGSDLSPPAPASQDLNHIVLDSTTTKAKK